MYGTIGTANYYKETNGINIIGLTNVEIFQNIKDGFFGLVINISILIKLDIILRQMDTILEGFR